MKDYKYATIVRWLIVIAIPFVLTLFSLRLMISWNSPSYPSFEYSRIPADRYGMSSEDRLRLAEASQEYLRRSESPEEVVNLISDLRLPGTNDPLYNQREIGHLVDVKSLIDAARTGLWILGIGVIAGLVLLLARPETRPDGYKAIMHGWHLNYGYLIGNDCALVRRLESGVYSVSRDLVSPQYVDVFLHGFAHSVIPRAVLVRFRTFLDHRDFLARRHSGGSWLLLAAFHLPVTGHRSTFQPGQLSFHEVGLIFVNPQTSLHFVLPAAYG